MEIYSSAKRRQKVTLKNCYKSFENEVEITNEEQKESFEMVELMKERVKGRFYNLMQYFFDIEEVK
ncbi:MAG: hypothetical protein WCK02_17080 [Bacteroidota bacterium]